MSSSGRSLRDLLRGNESSQAAPLAPKENARHLPARGKAAKPLPSSPLMSVLLDQTAPCYVTDRAGKLIHANRPFTDLAPQIFDGPCPDPLDVTPPDLMSLIEEVDETGTEVRRSDRISTGEAETFYISRHFPVADENGKTAGFGGVYENVTPLARATRKTADMEAWMQDIIRSSSDWIWAVDHNFNLTFASPRISEALGVAAQTLTGRHLFSLGSFDSKDKAVTRDSIERHAPFRDRIFLMPDDAGKTRTILLSGVPVFNDETGRFEGYRGTGTDDTRRSRAEKAAAESGEVLETTLGQLKQRNEELAQLLDRALTADKAKMDFLAMMSHELRTPLNGILGFSDAAKARIHGEIDPRYLEYFEHIHTAGEHLLGLITDILDSARSDSEPDHVEAETIDVGTLVSEAVSLVDLQAHHTEIATTDAHTASPLAIKANHLRARQIVVNLLSNAAKFTPAGGRIGVEITARPGHRIAITVWDTGIGIPETEQERIFERFYRVDTNILSQSSPGTGLGLSISRQLARLMGGDLRLESVGGEGSRFTLLLPEA